MKCRTGYRVGLPRITEAMNQQDGGRGTGYMGTGVYFYTDKKGMEYHLTRGKKHEEVGGYEIACACTNPLVIDGGNEDRYVNSDAMELHDYSKRLTLLARGYETSRYGDKLTTYCPRFLTDVVAKKMTEEGHEEEARYGAFTECQGMADVAVERTKNCLATRGNFNPQCSQPINHLLDQMGFDCVWPQGHVGETNTYGGVILREPMMRHCAGLVEARERRKGDEEYKSSDLDAEIFGSCFGLKKVA